MGFFSTYDMYLSGDVTAEDLVSVIPDVRGCSVLCDKLFSDYRLGRCSAEQYLAVCYAIGVSLGAGVWDLGVLSPTVTVQSPSST